MQRKHYSAESKAKVALQDIKGLKTINEIVSGVGVHPTQITLIDRVRSSWYYQGAQDPPYNPLQPISDEPH
jgi:hypothetical protein